MDNHIKDKTVKKKTAGYTCSYIPDEIITAAGFIPNRISGNKQSNLADKYFPINFCPYVKAVWEEVHHSNDFDALILATSCDGIRRLGDYISHYEKNMPYFMLNIPRKSDKASIDFFAINLKKLWGFLCSINNSKENETEKIIAASDKIMQKKVLLKELTKLYEFGTNDLINTSDYFGMINFSLNSEIAGFIDYLKTYIEKIKSSVYFNKNENSDYSKQLRIMVIGNYINDIDFWTIFDNLNTRIICSDLCITYRYFDIKPQENEFEYHHIKDIFKELSSRYLLKPACFRMTGMSEKLNRIKQQLNDNKIDGVIFTSLKFCDNTLYSFP
ncbi:2-hydroxyacyl-CoA dehydratase family protein, partial [bacterium]|nr:2-hydroxyacyl-CoA dehydratase family protein [bacterium]